MENEELQKLIRTLQQEILCLQAKEPVHKEYAMTQTDICDQQGTNEHEQRDFKRQQEIKAFYEK